MGVDQKDLESSRLQDLKQRNPVQVGARSVRSRPLAMIDWRSGAGYLFRGGESPLISGTRRGGWNAQSMEWWWNRCP